MKFFTRGRNILIIITLILLIVMFFSFKGLSHFTFLNNTISVMLYPFESFFSVVDKKYYQFIGYFKNINSLTKENSDLKFKIDTLEKENKELVEYKEKIKELKEALNIKDQYSNYSLIGANILSKDVGNWFFVFTLDRGSKDKLVPETAVINSKGLVGKIISVGPLSSKVVSIIDDTSVISARITKTRDLVVVKGDLSLKSEGLCRMNYIPEDIDISPGDVIETSGLSNVYPKGITIGKIKQIRKGTGEISRYALIEPAVNFKILEEVFILKNKTLGEDIK